MINLRTLVRNIKWKPFGILRRFLQAVSYRILAIIGYSLFALLRTLRLAKPVSPYDKARVRKIVVFRPDRIGDVILATPTLEALKEHFPQAHIALVVSTHTKSLVIDNPFVHQVVAIRHKGLFGILRERNFLNWLKAEHFDLAVVLYPVFWCNLLAFLGRIPYRLGHDFHGNGFLLTIKVPYRYEKEIKHEVDVNLDVVRAIGVQAKSKRLYVSVSQEAEGRIAEFFDQHSIYPEDLVVVVHPGSFEKYIRWRFSGFAAVCDRLIKKFAVRVVILAGPGEENLAQAVMKLMKERAVLAKGLHLSETVSLIKRAGLFLGNSTGTMHIAAGLGVPVVAVFGNIHPLDSYQKWRPFGDEHIVVHKDVGCKNCHPADCRVYSCMDAISVDEVFAACRRQIERLQGE